MVSSKKIHCAACDKKCSGNVLRYQNQYYHKQCFELEQEQSGEQQQHQQLSTTSEALEGTQVRPLGGFERGSQEGRGRKPFERDEVDSGGGELAAHKASQKGFVAAENNSNSNHLRPSSSTRRLFGGQSRNSLVSPGSNGQVMHQQQQDQQRSQTIDNRQRPAQSQYSRTSATLPHSISTPNGFSSSTSSPRLSSATCAGCREPIKDGQALIALELHWHVWCFKCHQCKTPLHGEYVAKDGKAYCEKDYQRLFGVTCVYCKRFITGKVLQAGETHHFHPSCARCSKCGDPFVPGEEMYLQGEVTWHPRCGPNPAADQMSQFGDGSQVRASRPHSPSLSSRSRSASPFSFMSRQYGAGGRASPYYADSEAVGDLSRVYTISYLNSDPNQGYLRRPIEPNAPKSPQFSRPTSAARSRSSSRSQHQYASSVGIGAGGRERSSNRGGMYSVLSGMRSGSGSVRARSPSMMNEEAIQLAQYPSGQRPSPDAVPKIERDDFPAPPFPAASSDRRRAASESVTGAGSGERKQQQQHVRQVRTSRPRSREINVEELIGSSEDEDQEGGKASKEEEELSKIASGIGKIFLQTLKEREKVRAWKRANLDPRNASRTPSAQRELASRPMRYENPANASPSRDIDRPRVWDDEADGELVGGEQSPTRTRSSLGLQSQQHQQQLGRAAAAVAGSASNYGYKVVQSNRYPAPRPGYGLNGRGAASSYALSSSSSAAPAGSTLSFGQQQQGAQDRSADLINRASAATAPNRTPNSHFSTQSSNTASHLRRSMPNVSQLLHLDGPPKLYPYHLLATSNYRLPPDVDRCHLERHLANEEFQYIFHCDRLDFYRLPEWKRNELKRRAKLF